MRAAWIAARPAAAKARLAAELPFYRHQVLSWPEQTGAIDPEGAEHTDMSPRMNTVDPYFGYFGHRIEGQFQLFSFDCFGSDAD